jgi:hypothetical protein
MRHYSTGGAPGRPRVSAPSTLPVPTAILGHNTLCPHRRCAPLALRGRSRVRGRVSRACYRRYKTLLPRPSASARYGQNCSRALRDRPLVPDINAKGGIESGGADDLKIAPFTLHISTDGSSERTGGRQWRWQWVVTLGKSGAAGAPAEHGGATILRRVFAVDPLQKHRRVIAAFR